MMNSTQETRLIELSRLSAAQRSHVRPQTGEEGAYIEMLDYVSSFQTPVHSRERMRTGHRELMEAIEVRAARQKPWIARFLPLPGPAMRAAPVALTAAVILATASGAAVAADFPSPNTAFSQVLSALGIKESAPPEDGPPPVHTPNRPPQAPVLVPPTETPERPDVTALPTPYTEDMTPPRLPPQLEEQDFAPPGQGGTNPGNGGGNGIGVGQGGTPPGQGGPNPSQGGENAGPGVGPDGTPPGQEGANPGQGGENAGQGGTPPGPPEELPGQGGSQGQGQDGSEASGQGQGNGQGQGGGQGGGQGNNP
jgi:hypothetical protein